MARVHPDLHYFRRLTAGDYAEYAVLQQLVEALPDSLTLFHQLAWSQGRGASEQHGELDIAVVDTQGQVLIIEVKAGAVEVCTDTGTLSKRYGGGARSVSLQLGAQRQGVHGRLAAAGLQPRLQQLLVLTSHRLQGESLNWPREQVVDASELDRLPARVMKALGPPVRPDEVLQRRVCAFLANQIEAVPDLGWRAHHVQQRYRQLTDGLATWVPRISAPSGIVQVQATAGSGKTQLALRLLQDAAKQAQRATYVCFNRPLADQIAGWAPVRAEVVTFHELARGTVEAAGLPGPWDSSEGFHQLESQAMALWATQAPAWDRLVVDEVQDLEPQWLQALVGRVREGGQITLLGDIDQSLYPERPSFEVQEAVTVRCMDNLRSPRAIVNLINLLHLTEAPVRACAPDEGDPPDPIVVDDERRMERATMQAVERCIQRGFPIQVIAVVTLTGRERSRLLASETLGAWRLRRFTGRFDAARNAIWTEGDLLIETVRRFKGQSAPAVVITECDFEQLDTLARRKLFVALSRAQLHVEWVLSGRAAAEVEACLATP